MSLKIENAGVHGTAVSLLEVALANSEEAQKMIGNASGAKLLAKNLALAYTTLCEELKKKPNDTQ